MKIAGRFGVYDVKWRVDGFTFAKVVVYATVRKSFLGLSYMKQEEVWVTNGRRGASSYRVWTFEKALPDFIRKVSIDAVDEYETYKEAWDKELECDVTVKFTPEPSSAMRIP